MTPEPRGAGQVHAEADTSPGRQTIQTIRHLLDESEQEVVLWIDFGGVICPGLGSGTVAVAELLGTPWEEMYRAADSFARTMGTSGMGPLELGLMTQDAWIDEVLRRCGQPHRAADLPGRFEDVWYSGRTIDRPFYQDLLEVRASGVPMGVLTNSVAEWEGPRRHMVDLDADFDAVVRSHVIHRMKPDPDIFAHAETLLGGAGAVHVLVDDLERNCVGAREAG